MTEIKQCQNELQNILILIPKSSICFFNGPLFIYFCLFNTADSKQMFNKKFPDD